MAKQQEKTDAVSERRENASLTPTGNKVYPTVDVSAAAGPPMPPGLTSMKPLRSTLTRSERRLEDAAHEGRPLGGSLQSFLDTSENYRQCRPRQRGE
jgi:hypothetical protein